jgi:hypothetical protein
MQKRPKLRFSCNIAEVFNRQFLTTETWVRIQVRPYGVTVYKVTLE